MEKIGTKPTKIKYPWAGAPVNVRPGQENVVVQENVAVEPDNPFQEPQPNILIHDEVAEMNVDDFMRARDALLANDEQVRLRFGEDPADLQPLMEVNR